jgi:hypothetical protein
LTVSYMAQGITRTVTYKRDSEMAAAITDLEGKLAGGGAAGVCGLFVEGMVTNAKLCPTR